MSRTYVIFARKTSQEALTRIGTVSGADDGSAAAAAKQEHGEDWLEMVAVPEGDMAWAIGEEVAK